MAANRGSSNLTGSEGIRLPLYDLQRSYNPDDLPTEIEEELSKLPEFMRAKARDKIRRFRDAIQPHTDEGGDGHYIGRFNEAVDPELLTAWKKDVQ